METKHTPGPWHFGHLIGVFAPAQKKFICDINADGKDYEENLANAELIAAAPETAAERDRLKAINAEIVEALEEFIDPVTGKIYVEFQKLIRFSHRLKIESAYAKAKGQ